jgi:decaprenyl-diphosphate synthase subunit 2
MEPFTSPSADNNSPFSLVAAPVIFTLQHNPSLFADIEQGKDSIEHVNYSKV